MISFMSFIWEICCALGASLRCLHTAVSEILSLQMVYDPPKNDPSRYEESEPRTVKTRIGSTPEVSNCKVFSCELAK